MKIWHCEFWKLFLWEWTMTIRQFQVGLKIVFYIRSAQSHGGHLQRGTNVIWSGLIVNVLRKKVNTEYQCSALLPWQQSWQMIHPSMIEIQDIHSKKKRNLEIFWKETKEKKKWKLQHYSGTLCMAKNVHFTWSTIFTTRWRWSPDVKKPRSASASRSFLVRIFMLSSYGSRTLRICKTSFLLRWSRWIWAATISSPENKRLEKQIRQIHSSFILHTVRFLKLYWSQNKMAKAGHHLDQVASLFTTRTHAHSSTHVHAHSRKQTLPGRKPLFAAMASSVIPVTTTPLAESSRRRFSEKPLVFVSSL